MSKMRLLHMKHRSQQYDDLLFTASITLIRKDRIMHQHCRKYFYVRGGEGLGISRIVDDEELTNLSIY